MLRLRLRDFEERGTLNGGGVELDAKARLALWGVYAAHENDLFLKMYPKRARVIRKCASRRGLASPRVTGCNAPQVSDEYMMLMFSPVRGLARHRPPRLLMQQNEGRNLLEMPRSWVHTSSSGAHDGCAGVPPETAAFAGGSGMGDDVFRFGPRASSLLATYGANRLGPRPVPLSLGSLIDGTAALEWPTRGRWWTAFAAAGLARPVH